MLLTHDHYREFTGRPIGDRGATARPSSLSRAAVAGGSADPNPVQDRGFMYSRSIEDPDGYVWEIMWMDPAAPAGTAQSA